jgi:F0F1-type ATP synthase membrane subunit b/b'
MEHTYATTEKLEAQLQHWGCRLDELVAQAAELGEDAKHESRKLIDELEVKHSTARARLDHLTAAGSEKWELFEQRIDTAWNDLAVAFGTLES